MVLNILLGINTDTNIRISIPEKSSVEIAPYGVKASKGMYIRKPATVNLTPVFFMEVAEWFKLKRYPHIGLPVSIKDYKWVKEYVEDPVRVKRHSFLPFIHKCIVQRKYRADKSNTVRNPCGKRVRIIGKPKVRPIFYSSHLDSQIFSFYNHLLYRRYEEYIEDKNFNTSVVAYRKIAGTEKGNKCNIDFAKTAFSFIHNRSDKSHAVIVADITSFFDNLCHKTLKTQWSKLLDKKTLPEDHYNVYKALTRIRYVDSDKLFLNCNKTMIVERSLPNSPKEKEYKKLKVKDIKYFKEKNVVAYCEKDDFLKNSIDLITSKNDVKGIPQGSPISATLANIYMLEFDQKLYDKITSPEINGFYQRYSDDLIIVCEKKYADDILKFLRETVANIVNLEIHPDKTKLYHFQDIDGIFLGFEVDEITKKENYHKTLGYLGFSYDGSSVLIKTAGFSKFYRSMKRSMKKSASLAKHSKNPDKTMFKSRLYKRFTHIGATRKLIYRPSKDDSSVYLKTTEFYWGNYLSYVNKANSVMQSINRSDIIRKQSRRVWKKFHNLLSFHVNSVNEFHGNSPSK